MFLVSSLLIASLFVSVLLSLLLMANICCMFTMCQAKCWISGMHHFMKCGMGNTITPILQTEALRSCPGSYNWQVEGLRSELRLVWLQGGPNCCGRLPFVKENPSAKWYLYVCMFVNSKGLRKHPSHILRIHVILEDITRSGLGHFSMCIY